MPTHLLVGNPTAQSGKNAARIDRARARLDVVGIDHDFAATLPKGATVKLVAEKLKAHPYDAVIYMGGDGTFAEVAKGLLQSGHADRTALAMLPTGTANDQGKSFGLSAEEDALASNVDVIKMNARCKLDVGHISAIDKHGNVLRQDAFFDSAGWGISPRVLKLRNEDRKTIESIPIVREIWRDHLVYAGALMRTFLASYVDDDKFDVDLVCDGVATRMEGLSDLVVKATAVYGGAWIFVRDSAPDDGLFEVVPFAGKRDWLSKAIVLLDGNPVTSEALSTIGVTHSESIRAKSIELRFHPRSQEVPLAAQIDGEEFVATERVRIEVEPRALTLVVPEKFAKKD
jgi:diacylglycerol kinase family enzyme